jgi:hypothetical protein
MRGADDVAVATLHMRDTHERSLLYITLQSTLGPGRKKSCSYELPLYEVPFLVHRVGLLAENGLVLTRVDCSNREKRHLYNFHDALVGS